MKKFLLVIPLVLAAGSMSLPSRAVTAPIPATRAAHPELAARLVKHLRAKYPNLEVGLARAAVSLDTKYPGLVYSLPRHLLEDLGDDAVVAVGDVLDAENARYPDVARKMREARERHNPRREVRELVASHYPKLRTELLRKLGDDRLGRHVRDNIQATMRDQAPHLRNEVAVEVSSLVDESYPGLPTEVLKRPRDSRILAWVRENHPEFVRAVRRRVLSHEGGKIRLALVAVLTNLEKDPSCRVAPRLDKLVGIVSHDYPELPAQALDTRLGARAALRAEIQKSMPDLGPVALETLASKHPDLLPKALASLHEHYPTLRTDLRAAVESQLPGIAQETRAFLVANYPDVAAKLPPL